MQGAHAADLRNRRKSLQDKCAAGEATKRYLWIASTCQAANDAHFPLAPRAREGCKETCSAGDRQKPPEDERCASQHRRCRFGHGGGGGEALGRDGGAGHAHVQVRGVGRAPHAGDRDGAVPRVHGARAGARLGCVDCAQERRVARVGAVHALERRLVAEVAGGAEARVERVVEGAVVGVAGGRGGAHRRSGEGGG